MHPEYDTPAPVLPSISDMKVDEAEVLGEHGGVLSKRMGGVRFARILSAHFVGWLRMHTHKVSSPQPVLKVIRT